MSSIYLLGIGMEVVIPGGEVNGAEDDAWEDAASLYKT
jgi:hypothetical protein